MATIPRREAEDDDALPAFREPWAEDRQEEAVAIVPLSWQIESREGVSVMALAGQARNDERLSLLSAEVTRLQRESGDLLLDIGAVQIAGTRFLKMLVHAHWQANRSGRLFGVCAPSAESSRYLGIAHLEKLLSVLPDVGAGLAQVRLRAAALLAKAKARAEAEWE